MPSRPQVVVSILLLVAVIGGFVFYLKKQAENESVAPSGTAPTQPSAAISQPTAPRATNQNPDLTTDSAGLSKATVILTTSEGVVKFKFYPSDAPNTVKRIIELINQVENPNTRLPGFYNGLTFHRVVPGFVVQGGDPVGNGTGGSGVKLKAEFNSRRHIEGAVAMARAQDPDSADSQFYITTGQHPHLDHSYTVFGQVVEGMDVVKRLKIGDKIVSMIIE